MGVKVISGALFVRLGTGGVLDQVDEFLTGCDPVPDVCGRGLGRQQQFLNDGVTIVEEVLLVGLVVTPDLLLGDLAFGQGGASDGLDQ